VNVYDYDLLIRVSNCDCYYYW